MTADRRMKLLPSINNDGNFSKYGRRWRYANYYKRDSLLLLEVFMSSVIRKTPLIFENFYSCNKSMNQKTFAKFEIGKSLVFIIMIIKKHNLIVGSKFN